MTDFSYDRSAGRWDSQTWSLTVFRSVFGIRVRVSLFLILLYVSLLIKASYDGVFVYGMLALTVLFGVVLLHEFGHCFGCRAVKGEADDILMWPLGGLAYCRPPHQPMESLITVVAGPAVNLALCLLTLVIMTFSGNLSSDLLYPWSLQTSANAYFTGDYFGLVVSLIFETSYILLLFNLLPIYPLDGGRALQCFLWMRMSHARATLIATTIGMWGAGILGAFGLWYNEMLVAVVALFCFFDARKERLQTLQQEDITENEFGYDFSQGFTSLERSSAPEPGQQRAGFLGDLGTKINTWSEERRQKESDRLEAELDRILEKIHESGLNSLSKQEKRTLTEASKKRRNI